VGPDPDPAIFVIDLQVASKKLIINAIFSAYYFLKVHLHHFSKIKSQKESQIFFFTAPTESTFVVGICKDVYCLVTGRSQVRLSARHLQDFSEQ
jgi:hypothetical protein